MRARRSHRAMAALALASVALGACSVLTGLDADYSSSAHDGAAAIGNEGGGDGGPGSDAPSGMEGSTTDGMVTPDAEAGPTTWCRSMQDGSADMDFFCTDFEGVPITGNNQPPTGWNDLTNLKDAGALFLVDADGGHALDVMGKSDGTGGAHTRLRKLLSTADAHQYLHYQLDYDFSVLTSSLQYAGLGFLVFADSEPTTKEHGIATYGPSAVILSHQGGSSITKTLMDPGGWHHATITLERMTTDATYKRTITIDGTNDVDDAPSGHVVGTGDPTELWLGIFYGAPAAGTAHVQFDNVVFRRTR